MYKSHSKLVCLLLALVAVGCAEAEEFRFGENISGVTFEFFDEREGVHPSKVVLLNPRNPFREYSIGDETKFAILGGGGNAGAFYAFATLLASVPTGEHQFYAAGKLRDIYMANEVPREDLLLVRQMAIDGFQAVLDDFPDSVIFNVLGTTQFRLATPAFKGIVELGGDPLGDWFLVIDSKGDEQAVKGSGVDAKRPEPPAEDDL